MPLVLTVTVRDQVTADLFHDTAAYPPVLAPNDPSSFASKAQAAAIALTSLIRTDIFRGINMADLGTDLAASPLSYPAFIHANMSLTVTEAWDGFVANKSPSIDPQTTAMEAFMEAAAFEIDLAVTSLGNLPDAIGVSNQKSFLVCYGRYLSCTT